MEQQILVPLDRSETSRSVLPMVADMARGSGGTVRLLHVAPIPTERVSDDGRVVAYVSQEMERIEYSRLDYLKEAEAGLEGVPVESVVRFGDPAEEIVACARDTHIDLVAMATHGRTGLRHLLMGSVAEQVLRRLAIPVMLVRPFAEET